MSWLERIAEADFMPHGYCYLWFPEVLWLNVLSDGLIALSYFMIPTSLSVLVLKRRELPFPWIFLMFASFISACGMTHVMGIWTVWRPDYGVEGLVKLGTGLISITTAMTLIPLMPKALALRSPAELEAVNRKLAVEVAEHRRTEAALDRARAELEEKVGERTAALSRANELLQREIDERRRAQEQQQLLLRELNHRVRNTLATVQSLVTQTLLSSPAPEAFAEAFTGRLMALAHVHTALTQSNWRGATLRGLALAELAPYRSSEGRDNVAIEGDAVSLPPQPALALSLALHELATNAAKHGALSVPEGRVGLSWSVRDTPDGAQLAVEWVESGGPPVAPPSRRGFGTRLIERIVAHELGGSSRLEFREEGVRCEVRMAVGGLVEEEASPGPSPDGIPITA
ncbi:MAG TPA: HWE histidine kinase domain-containing protein [Geminicoccaceae bacterium]|nr:HWE histidine kinase domain-containing protein [Geminicoccaceae bacterium]